MKFKNAMLLGKFLRSDKTMRQFHFEEFILMSAFVVFFCFFVKDK